MEDTVVLSSTDFQTSAHQILRQLWNDKDFTDVTLATADDQEISAHKSILSACSPFFAHLLATHPHPAPLLYLRGVQARELSSLLQYMYLGESQVQSQHLDVFLQVGYKSEPVTGLLSYSTAHIPCKESAVEFIFSYLQHSRDRHLG